MHCFGRGSVGRDSLDAHGQDLSAESYRAKRGYDEKLLRSANPLAAVPWIGGYVRRRVNEDSEISVDGATGPSDLTTPRTVLRLPPVGERVAADVKPLLELDVTQLHSSLKQRNRVLCRFCFRCIQLDGDLEGHLVRCRSIPLTLDPSQYQKLDVASRNTPRTSDKSKCTCSACGQSFRFQSELRSHTKSCPRRNATSPSMAVGYYVPRGVRSSPAPARVKKKSIKLLQCPHCGAMVKSTRLDGHIRKVHGQVNLYPAHKHAPADFDRDEKVYNTVLPPDFTSTEVF